MSAPPLTLGTAGHIDHGKAALVQRLTGTDTDRLPEERARGISIALGYALLELHGPAVAVGGEDLDELAARLRAADPPVIGRIEDGRLLLDPRTLDDAEAGEAAAAVVGASG